MKESGKEPIKRGRPFAAVKRVKRSITFPPTVYQQLEEIGAREERTVNELVVEAVRALIKEKASGNSVELDMAA